jgi:hypothetical protein
MFSRFFATHILHAAFAAALTCSVGVARANTVNFEDNALAAESYFNGPTANAVDEPDPYGGELPVKVGTFTSGGAAFGNEFNANYFSWGGFAYSNVTDNTTPGFGNQFSAFAGGGHGPGADNYGVAFGYNGNTNPTSAADVADLPHFVLPSDGMVQSAYFTNTTYSGLSMRDGDQYAKQFGGPNGDESDWFKLSIYGVTAQGDLLPQSVEFYLADYRGDNDYIVSAWTLVDLSPLAAARSLFFNLSSTDNGDYGMNTPATFAIDDIQFVQAPEPASWALLAVGMAALVVRRRRAR